MINYYQLSFISSDTPRTSHTNHLLIANEHIQAALESFGKEPRIISNIGIAFAFWKKQKKKKTNDSTK